MNNMDIFSTIINLPIAQIVGLLLVVGFAEKMGLPVVDFIKGLLIKKNSNGTNKKLGEIDEHLELLTSNHIVHMTEELREIKEAIKEHDRNEMPILRDIAEGIVHLKAKTNGFNR